MKHVVAMRGCAAIDDPLVMTWDAFVARGDAVPDASQALSSCEAQSLSCGLRPFAR